jgi:ketosteroid isomerase-like protein
MKHCTARSSVRHLTAWALLACLTAITTAGAATLPTSTAGDVASVDEAVRTWAESWDRGDVSQYLDHYAGDFVPAGGLTRTQWEQQRRSRLKTSAIRHVMLRDVEVAVNSDTANAEFTQHYLDMDLMSTARKRLMLVKQAGTWKIRQEMVETERAIRR